MFTYGLNRPLFSFGLSYPGYFFVAVPVPEGDGEFTIYKVHEANRYRAAALAREFLALHDNSYIVHPSPGEIVTDYYVVWELVRVFIPYDQFTYQATDVVLMKAYEGPREFLALDSNSYKAAEAPRRFIATEDNEYAEFYRR
jgi:hypothetical protein